MSINRVLLGGGSGFIGSAIKKALQNNGAKVCVVSRMPAPDSITWEELNKNGIPAGTNAIINVAGQNVLDPTRRWTPGFKQNVIASRIHTNKLLSHAISRSDDNLQKIFITISGVGFYPPDSNLEYDEESPGGNSDFLSIMCGDWEDASKVNNDNCRNVVVRTGIVLGPNGGIIKQMYPLFYLGLGGKIGSGTQYMPWIHIDDLSNIFVQAIQNEHFSGVINATAPQMITNGQFTKALGRALWRPAIFLVPEMLLNFVFNPERAVLMTKGQKVISKRMQQLGYELKYKDIDTALHNILATKK